MGAGEKVSSATMASMAPSEMGTVAQKMMAEAQGTSLFSASRPLRSHGR